MLRSIPFLTMLMLTQRERNHLIEGKASIGRETNDTKSLVIKTGEY
jgi:hypothetical protein